MASTHLRNHLLNIHIDCRLNLSSSSNRPPRCELSPSIGTASTQPVDSRGTPSPIHSRRLPRVTRPDAGARWNRGEAGDAGSAARGWRRMRAHAGSRSRRARSHSTFAGAANVAQRIGTLTPGRPAHSKQFAGIGGVALSPADARARESAPKRRRPRAAPRGRARSGGGGVKRPRRRRQPGPGRTEGEGEG